MDNRLVLTFWSQVEPYNLTDADACAIWVGLTNDQGYGRIHFDGESLYAHRVAWSIFHGPIPQGLVIRHRCHNPSCVRPTHLDIGPAEPGVSDVDDDHALIAFITHCSISDISNLGVRCDAFNDHFREYPFHRDEALSTR